MVKLIQRIIGWFQRQRLKAAIRKANRMFAATGMKFYVLRYNKGFLVKSKQELTKLVKDGYFQKGVSIQTIGKLALYQTR